MLQAYLDDSREAGKLLVLGGYVATAESWAAFADEWAEMLPFVRPMDEFKMSEIASRWGETDERIMWFYRIIEKRIICEFSIGVPLDIYEEEVKAFHWKFKGMSPYAVAVGALFGVFASRRHELDLDGPIEFICDEQMDEKMKFYEAFEGLTRQELMAPQFERLFTTSPRFSDSKRFLPLQAADFFVWWMRKGWLKSPGEDLMWPYPWPMKRETKLMQIYFDNLQMRNQLWHVSNLITARRSTHQPNINENPWFWPSPTCRFL